MTPKVGFIGLGEMGMAMARNIARAGFPLNVYDLRKEHVEKIVSHGAFPAENPKDLAQKSNWIMLSLPDTETVKTVLFGPLGIVEGLHKSLVVIDFGTTHPLATREIAASLKKHGVPFLDAPVSGMKARAEQGTLTIMVGGEENVFEKVKPVLSAIGNKIIYMGCSGNGQLAKLVNQLLFNINTAAIAEILPLAV
ncbi:MAG: NAD(P)-dependent oxidoreductase, partial [Candidatus Aminicenantes bacterium]|nr:NAD(P)-dependent oxidoreductase [Candidatus Aminicenantes bacterium]